MGHNSVGNIDGEVVTGIAFAPLRHEDEIPGAIIRGSRVCHRCRGDKADCCNHPKRRRLHYLFSIRQSGRFQANATDLVDIRIGERRVADIRTMIFLRKSRRRALVETCSNYPESCESQRVSSGPNSSADSFEHDWSQSSSRVQSRLAVRMHIGCTH